jgi:hypothetical protein
MHEIDDPSNIQSAEKGQPDEGLRQPKSSTTDEIIRRGQEALLRRSRSYDDWMNIAEALAIGRVEVMAAIQTSRPTGKRYAKTMGEWLFARSFHLINEGTRNRLLECLKHRAEIEKWRATLTENECLRINHPDAVFRKWEASTVVPDPNTPPKTCAFAKLKEANIELQERLHRAECELSLGDGDLWTPSDTAEDIARIMLEKLSTNKAGRVAYKPRLQSNTQANRSLEEHPHTLARGGSIR